METKISNFYEKPLLKLHHQKLSSIGRIVQDSAQELSYLVRKSLSNLLAKPSREVILKFSQVIVL